MKKHVVIIGAGAAGLFAASALCDYCDVTLIESRDQPGGRIRSTPLLHGEGTIEAGAEFVHGDLPITNALIKEAGLTKLKVQGKMYRKEGSIWKEQEEMIEGWDELVEKMEGEPEDMTMQAFMDKNLPEEKYAALRRHIKLFVQGFDLADPAEISVKSLYKEWSAEEEQFRIKEGYGSLITHLHKKIKSRGCHLIFNDAAKKIDWKKNAVSVTTLSGKKIEGHKLIITLPVGMLVSHSIHSLTFNPEADEYLNAYRQIGYGSVVKVVLDFKQKFWQKDMGFVFSEQPIPTWWSQLPISNNLLTGWAGGPNAKSIQDQTDDELLETALRSISGIYDKSVEEIRNNLRQSYVFNWIRFEDASGAYSFATPDTETARKLLLTPLDDTIYFAGEGLIGDAYPGTVEAAFKNADDTAKQIKSALD